MLCCWLGFFLVVVQYKKQRCISQNCKIPDDITGYKNKAILWDNCSSGSRSSSTWPTSVFDSSQKQMLRIRLQKTFLLGACMCLTTLRSFLTYQVLILSQVTKNCTFFPSVRVISYEEGKALAESWNAAFLESSAKENQVRGLRITSFE